jgi:hypothetical protein
MTFRVALVLVAAAMVLAGCRKAPASKAIPGTGSAPPAAAPAATGANDYRTLTIPELEIIIADKSGSPVKNLKSAGPNKYTGTRMSPDGTAQLQVTVTVEAGRIMIETHGGGLSATDVITPRGFEPGNPR